LISPGERRAATWVTSGEPQVVLATYYTNFEPSEAGHAEN
jgi:hypothetical protein